MIKTVIKILKRHLDEGVEAFDQMNDALSLITNYDILAAYPDNDKLVDLAKELITTIRGVEYTELVKLPNEQEIAEFLIPHMPCEEKYTRDMAEITAPELLRWLIQGKHRRVVPLEGQL